MPSQTFRSPHAYRLDSLLANSQRRVILAQLAATGRMDIESLADTLTAFEREMGEHQEDQQGSPDGDLHTRVTIALVHDHLPRLDDHDVVEYDSQSGEVQLSGSVNPEARLGEHLVQWCESFTVPQDTHC